MKKEYLFKQFTLNINNTWDILFVDCEVLQEENNLVLLTVNDETFWHLKERLIYVDLELRKRYGAL